MEDMIESVLGIYNRLPFPVIACLLGWLVSVGITQPVKFALPLNWYPRTRQIIAQGVAFASAFLTVYGLIVSPTGIVLGVIVGLWSPIAYAVAINLLEERYPRLTDILSGDVRGVMKGDVRENRP